MAKYIVLNPKDSTYKLKEAEHIDDIASELLCKDVEVNGTYIAHNSPAYQVIEIEPGLDVYDLR